MSARRSTAATPFKWADPKTGRESWRFVVELGPTPDGKRRQARRAGFPTKKAAQEALDQLRVDVRQRSYVTPQRQTLASWLLDDWLPTARRRLEPSTWASYDRYLRLHVIPAVGGVQLQALEAGHLDHLYAGLLAEGGRRDGKPGGLSGRTVKYIHTILGRALRDAVKAGRLVRSPADAAEPPGAGQAKPPEMVTWTATELGRFLEAERGSRYFTSWLLLATTGMRRGEALGLRWSDVDLDAGRAAIRQTVTAVNHEIRIAARTKTGKGRVIDLDEGTISVLRSWRALQAKERLLLGEGYAESDLVLCHPDGRPFHPDRFSREFDRRVERHALRRVRLHDLRHTWATLALQGGVHPKVVQERLGHASIGVTLDVYSHVSQPMKSEAAELVAGLIRGTGRSI